MYRYKLRNIKGVNTLTLNGIRFSREWLISEDKIPIWNDNIIEEEIPITTIVVPIVELPIPVKPLVVEKEIDPRKIEKEELIESIKLLDLNNIYDSFELEHSSKVRLNKIYKELRNKEVNNA